MTRRAGSRRGGGGNRADCGRRTARGGRRGCGRRCGRRGRCDGGGRRGRRAGVAVGVRHTGQPRRGGHGGLPGGGGGAAVHRHSGLVVGDGFLPDGADTAQWQVAQRHLTAAGQGGLRRARGAEGQPAVIAGEGLPIGIPQGQGEPEGAGRFAQGAGDEFLQHQPGGLVAHLHNGTAGKQVGQILIPQVELQVLVGTGGVVLGDFQPGPARLHRKIHRIPRHGGTVFQNLVVAVVGKFQRCLAGSRPDRPVVAGARGVVGRRVEGGVDVSEGGVDVVGHGKLQHAAHNLANTPQYRHIVVGGAGIGIDVGAVHNHLHQVGAGSIAVGGLPFLQVVGAGGQGGLSVGEDPRSAQGDDVPLLLALVAGGHRVKGNRSGVDGAVGYLVGGVQGKFRPGQRGQTVLGQFLHEQIVFQVGHKEPDGKFPAESAVRVRQIGVQPHGVGGGGVGQAGGAGAVKAHRVLGVVGGQLAVGGQHIVVGQDVAGQVLDGVLVGAAAVQHKQVGVGPGGLQNGRHAGVARHVPAVDGIPRYGVPVTLGAAAVPGGVLALQHHRKVGAVVRGIALPLQILYRVGQGDGDHGAGVGAGIPGVGRKQGGQLEKIVGEIELHIAGGPVTGWHRHLPQHKLAGLVGTTVLVFQVVQAQQGTVGVLEHKGAVRLGGARGDQVLGVVCIVVVGIVQVKAGTRHRVADLVHLDQVALGDGNQIEFQLHVGIYIAPFQVKELQGVVGVVGKGVRVRVGPAFACGQEFFPQRSVGLVVHPDGPGAEVDAQGGGVMDAAQIPHQHIVDEDPHVVVAGELIGHGGTGGGTVHRAVGLLHKPGGHGQPEIVVDHRVAGVHVLDHAVVVEGEKLSQQRYGPGGAYPRPVVHQEGVGGLVVLGKILGAVVVIIALLVNLQQIMHVGKGDLAGIGQRRVEQIRQRLPALHQLGIAVLQGGVHHAGARGAAACVVVDARPPPGVGGELQRLAGVDALVHVGGIDVVRVKPAGDPVVEQIDGGADGGNRVGYQVPGGPGRGHPGGGRFGGHRGGRLFGTGRGDRTGDGGRGGILGGGGRFGGGGLSCRGNFRQGMGRRAACQQDGQQQGAQFAMEMIHSMVPSCGAVALHPYYTQKGRNLLPVCVIRGRDFSVRDKRRGNALQKPT